jgi:dihydroorotate dehydrogenase electron transfer subunit
MRLYRATLAENRMLRQGLHLLELEAPELAQAVRPGQYCMVRCAEEGSFDPLLRRPFFVHSIEGERCRILLQVRGRGTAWLARRSTGEKLDLLGPLGQGWRLPSRLSTLLLVAEGFGVVTLALLAQRASEQGLAVTLVQEVTQLPEGYPAALLPEEVEYRLVTSDGGAGQQSTLLTVLGDYLSWADAVCLGVSRETALQLRRRFERLRHPGFAQVAVLQPLVCGTGTCLACALETGRGPRLICQEGPIFDLQILMQG